MPLESLQNLMGHAERGGYAVGYFESWSIDSVLGVIDAAELTSSPVLIGFNGEFLSTNRVAEPDELAVFASLLRAAAAMAEVPCAVVFNECSSIHWLARAITSGFNLVMPADIGGPTGSYTDLVNQVTTLAHSHGVAVESQVEAERHDVLTDSVAAANFISRTAVDLLAVEVGNEEIRLQGRVPLDLGRLEEIRAAVDIPLVLHGGTGIDDASLQAAVSLGVRKINFGTYLKQRYLEAMKAAVSLQSYDPHVVLGGGGDTDVFVIGREVIRDAVLERIDLLGCCGKAQTHG